MRKSDERPRTDLPTAVTMLLDKRVYRNWYMREILPWEQLVDDPSWRVAKQLLKVDPDLVSQIVERLVASAPALGTNKKARMCLGKVRQHRGEHAAALSVFETMDEWDFVIPATYNAGLCHAALGNADAAAHAFRQVLERNPGDVRATKALAELQP